MGTPTPRIPSVACTEFTNAILTEFIGDSGFVLFEWCILVIAINIELVSCYDSVFWIIPFFFFFLRVRGIFKVSSCIHMELEILQRRYHCNEDI